MHHNSKMRSHISIAILFAFFHLSAAFMAFTDLGDLMKCYRSQGDNRIVNEIVNGQTFPLPNSIETFISLVERLESLNPSPQPIDIIRKLLVSFRVNEVPANLRFQDETWEKINTIEKAFFSIDNVNYAFKETDVSEDEKCALHLMLSHSLNDTLQGVENEEAIDGVSKHPKEYGVVSLHGKKKHAFALGKVLLGIYAGLMGNNELDAGELSRKTKNPVSDDRFNGIKVNRLISVTIADLVTAYISDKNFKREMISFMPNGEWKDTSCTTDYLLEDNNKKSISNSLIRGAIDGIIIGRKIETNPGYRNTRLSEILRMYYGPTGLIDATDSSSKVDLRSDFQWCRRMDNFRAIQNINENILNYLRVYKNLAKNVPTDELLRDITDVLANIQSSSQIFNDISDESTTECGRSDTALEKCKTPADIFPILDWAANDNVKNPQIELLGLLSTDFEVRPYGNSIGAYTNLSPMQTNKGLHVIANNTGIAGCSSCYVRHNKRVASTKQGEVEVMLNLNQTLTEFVDFQDSSDTVNLETLKRGTPAKVVLYFNSGSPTDDYRLRDALWEIEKNFREVTILAIGSKKESLQVFTRNDDMDIFTDTANTAALALKLKSRICKVPAEFRYKECFKNSRGSEADNKQSGFIPVNKRQYWAMYPKYFLKSFNIKLKFKALDGAQIKVCFSRSYYRITEEGYDYKECRDTSGDAEFTLSNPCYRKNVHNCDPFYFSIEGVKPGTGVCESLYCRTPKDIVFEFSHEGISCNSSTLIFSSSLLILISILFTLFKRE